MEKSGRNRGFLENDSAFSLVGMALHRSCLRYSSVKVVLEVGLKSFGKTEGLKSGGKIKNSAPSRIPLR